MDKNINCGKHSIHNLVSGAVARNITFVQSGNVMPLLNMIYAVPSPCLVYTNTLSNVPYECD
jgi:hypothetical protein